jgi:ABC-type Fe3+/spermidine/putrescine transport system ATPase subunit
MVFQSYALWPHLTVGQNISFGLEVRKLSRSEVAQRVQSALELVRLSSFAQRYPHEISGGQQQRVALARALVLEPHVILLDEPLSNLDARLREEIRGELAALHARLGITMVYVTHDQDDALILADRVALLNQGSIEQVGSPRAVYESPRTIFAAQFFGAANLIPCRFVRMSSDTTMVVELPSSADLAGSADAAGVKEITVRCAPVSTTTSPHHPPSTVTVCVRPEAIQFDPHAGLEDAGERGGEVARLRARVRRSTYHGAWCDLLVETELNISLTIRTATTSPAPTPQSGDLLTIGWQPESAVVIQGA